MSTITRCLRCVRRTNLLAAGHNVLATQQRNGQWPPNYIWPVYKKEKIAELKETGQYKELAFAPVRSARASVSSSLYCDPFFLDLENLIMRHGKKEKARAYLHWTMWEIKKAQCKKYSDAKTDEERAAIELDPAKVIRQAIENVQPVVITKSIKRGGATYQVPHPISAHYSEFLAKKWLIDTAKERPKPKVDRFPVAFAREILAAYYSEGKVIKKKHDMHKLCEANKAYAHYRWG